MPFRVHPSEAHTTAGACAQRSWRVMLRCDQGDVGWWSARKMGELFPAGVTLAQIGARVVCSTCGSREGVLELRQDHDAERAGNLDRIVREGR